MSSKATDTVRPVVFYLNSSCAELCGPCTCALRAARAWGWLSFSVIQSENAASAVARCLQGTPLGKSSICRQCP